MATTRPAHCFLFLEAWFWLLYFALVIGLQQQHCAANTLSKECCTLFPEKTVNRLETQKLLLRSSTVNPMHDKEWISSRRWLQEADAEEVFHLLTWWQNCIKNCFQETKKYNGIHICSQSTKAGKCSCKYWKLHNCLIW